MISTANPMQMGGASSLHKNPLFSLSDLYEPKDIKEIFEFCRKIVLTNEVVSSALHKLSEAPVTEMLYEHEDEEVKDRYQTLFEKKLRIRERILELIFDLVTYSNAFASLEVPVTRFLVSPNVHEDFRSKYRQLAAGDMQPREFDHWYAEAAGQGRGYSIPKRFKIQTIDWKLTGKGHFKGKCPITGKKVQFERVDRYYANADNISIKRWDPNQIEIHHNDVTGESKYYYNMKKKTRELIKKGDRDMFNEVPWEYIVAARTKRNVRLVDENFYHLSNVKVSGAFSGWGVPRLYSAFRMIFYYITLLKANQSIAVGKINDLNILFPSSQGSSTGTDPASAIPGSDFARHISSMLKKHQKDPNFTGISPIPVGVASVFGQGKMQLISGELEPVVRAICTAMGLPYDMLYGGGQYSGQAVAQRLFSAQTGLHRERFNEFIDFIVNRISAALGRKQYPSDMSAKLKPEEGPDALQEKQTLINMAMNNQASLTTALEALGYEWDTEKKRMESEARDLAKIQKLQAKQQAHAQAEGQEIMQRSQMQLQEEQAQQQAAAQQQQMQQQQMQQGGPPQNQKQMEAQVAQTGPVQQQAMIMFKFLQQYPDRIKQVLMLAQEKYPEAGQLLMQWIEGGGPSMEAPSAEAPTAEAPEAAPQGGQQQGGQQAPPQGPPPGQPQPNQPTPAQAAPAQGGQFQKQPGPTGTGGGGQQMPVSDQQPEQLPPRRQSGGL